MSKISIGFWFFHMLLEIIVSRLFSPRLDYSRLAYPKGHWYQPSKL